MRQAVTRINLRVAASFRGHLNPADHTEQLERRLITIALACAKGNKSAAARLLGITRNGLLLKLERLGINA